MRMCQSILIPILAISLISCQTAPQSPVRQDSVSRPVPLNQSPKPYALGSDDTQKPAAAPTVSRDIERPATDAVSSLYSQSPESMRREPESVASFSKSTTPSKKVSPIPPHYGSVQTGLLSPPSQEVVQGAPPAEKERQRIVLNFDKAEVGEVTSQIFGDQLKLNYVLDQTLQGRISMYIEGDFSPSELLHMVTRAYEANGISVVPRKGFYFIQASQKAGGSLPIADQLLLKPDKTGARPLIVIYRLRYMDPKQAATLIGPFLSPGRKAVPETVSNSIVFVEDSDNAKTIINLLKTIDINILQEVSMEIVPLQTIAPQDAVQGMDSLLGKLGGFKDSSIKNSLAFIPLQNFGGVLVMAQTPELLKSAKQWLLALDVQGVETGQQIYVYFVQNGLARDIADILNSVFGLSGATGAKRMEQQVVPAGRTATRGAFGGTGGGFGSSGSSAFGRTSSSGFGSSGTSGGMSGSSYGGSTSRAGTSAGGISGTSGTSAARAGISGAAGGAAGAAPSIFSGEVIIIADEVNNAIVIRANASDYSKVKKTMESLDILPRAVLIEVLIAEVQLTKEFQYGLQYYFQAKQNGTGFGLAFGNQNATSTTTTITTSAASSLVGQAASSIVPSIPTGLATIAGKGLAMGWVASAQDLAFFLQALSSKTNVTVLSTPTLLATDNKEATITVGGREPVPTGSYTGTESTTSGIFSTIQYEETGIILNVTPHINAGGLVRLEVEQTIRRVDPNTVTVGANNTAPRFTERDVKTTLLAQNGTTVVIGGIIQTNKSDNKTGIPFLQDVPLLSPLFAGTSKNLDRTELIVAITPHVIDQRGSEAPKEFLEKLKNLKRRIER